MSTGSSISDANTLFLASIICFLVLGGSALHLAKKEAPQVTDAASQPVVPKRVNIQRVSSPMTPNDRVRNSFFGIAPPERAKPEDIWAYARRNDG